ncbi:hypothetical protein [Alkalihalobacterium bogoriense]|uniref:hypothetical protein n=1 Tax=Alkalihalobacterium bogoriense TaxID=246272 RepID=UPI0004788CFD|nr:hypothetical protein [Alkalihalobacterium bogoriense]
MKILEKIGGFVRGKNCKCDYALSLIVSPTLVSAQPIQKEQATNELNDYLFSLSKENKVDELEDVLSLLTAIEEMPAEIVFASDKVKAQWIYVKTGKNISNGRQKSDFIIYPGAGEVSAYASVGQIAALLTFTPAILLKVKAGLKAVCGAKTFVHKFSSAYKTLRHKEKKPHTAIQQAAQRAAAKAAPEARAALADLFGVGVVIGACSWIFEK